jgi:hypothetical protein
VVIREGFCQAFSIAFPIWPIDKRPNYPVALSKKKEKLMKAVEKQFNGS